MPGERGKLTRLEFKNFIGLNTKSSSETLQDQQLRIADNADFFSSYGAVSKAGGGAAKNTSDALINIGNAIYGASPEMIQGMADYASKKGGTFGTMIVKTLSAIKESPQGKQRAVLFTLMQQPDFRKFAQEYMADGKQ